VTYTRIYADKDGETHFEDVTVNMTDSRHAKLSEMIAAKGMIFRLTKDYFVDWHPAPRRQFVVNLSGEVEIVASDGEKRVLGRAQSCWPMTSTARATPRAVSARPSDCRCLSRSPTETAVLGARPVALG
jgi:hypothetical protein